jgi:hypothetical protein
LNLTYIEALAQIVVLTECRQIENWINDSDPITRGNLYSWYMLRQQSAWRSGGYLPVFLWQLLLYGGALKVDVVSRLRHQEV